MSAVVCAVDVGTRSARAGVFDLSGRRLARHTAPFAVFEGPGSQAEYRFDDIWQAVCTALRGALAEAEAPPETVAALAFDATCSLVLTDLNGAPLPLGPEGCDTIAWFDHRATAEADICSATGHPLIAHLGGSMSPEMQTPKLMWLKRQRPDLWPRLGGAFDLADALVSRAIGQPSHSAATLAAKWAYLPENGGWQTAFLTAVGLDDLLHRARLPATAPTVGARAGMLSAQAAGAFGLPIGTPVATGMIDAFAGALTALPQTVALDAPRAALIMGTSSTIIMITPKPVFASGIWGPFAHVVAPGLWASEGGLSAAGALLDYVLALWSDAHSHGAVLDRIAVLLGRDGPGFASHVNVLPDFHGSRAPFADAAAHGVISGLTLDHSLDALCALYWRTAVALALGTRQILDHMAATGLCADTLCLAGGLTRSPLLVQLYADATGRSLRVPAANDAVLLGTAMAASVAGCAYPDLAAAGAAMAGRTRTITPNPTARARFDRDYTAFLLMQRHRAELVALP